MKAKLEAPGEHPDEVIKRLQRCINDLVSILTLPATWSDSEPSQIVGSLLAVLLDMLGLDLAYMRLEDPTGGNPVEMVRCAQPQSSKISPQEIRTLLNQSLPEDPRKWPLLTRGRVGGNDLSIAPRRLGLQGEIGVIIAGSQRLDFPSQTEALLLQVAVNQAVITLQQARHLSEQKRFANELDQLVAQRTAQLAAAIEELKQSQAALRKTEEKTRMIIDTALDAVVSMDVRGTITSWNKEAEVIFGWGKEDATGRPLADLIIPEHQRAAHTRGLARFLATGEGPVLRRRIEITAIRRSGVEFPVELEILPMKLGKEWFFSAFIRDITEQKKAEAVKAAQTLQAGIRADVSAAFSATDDLKTILNSCAEAIVRHLDAAFARIWTLNESENVLELQASAGLYTGLGGAHARVPMGQLKIGRIAEEGKPHLTNDVLNDERVSDRDWAKREGMVAFAGYPLFVEGRVTGVLAMFARRPLDQTVLDALESVADIIAHGICLRDAEDKLRQRERSLRLLTETIPQMIWSATASGETDYCNRQIIEYTGRREDQLLGNGWAEVIHPDDLPTMQESWRSAVANQFPFEMEFRQRRADGMFRWCLSRAQPLCDEQGRVIRWYGSITDLDDWKRAQEELRKAQANLARTARLTTMGELTTSIAHEVNQPLTAVVTNANACLRWLDYKPPNLEEVHAAVERIIRDGNRGADVIARIRGLMKKEHATRAALDLNEIIREIITLLQGDLQGATLRTDLTSELPRVNGDRVQLQQVLLNLTMNAMDAMRPVTHRPHVLSIQTKSHEGRAVLVAVQDTGVGLNSAGTEKLFETFYTTKAEGLGMGLSICRSIIEGHGGRLWAEPNEGSGARFQFTLPIEHEGTA